MIGRNGILVIIVIAQFACVSLWFAGNGVMDALISEFNLPLRTVGHLTSAVQLGFILGTLLFAIFAFADRYSPSNVFFLSAIAAALCNLGLVIADGNTGILYASRFMTGFFLAGIYPVGMKIAADYFDKDLGKALGFLLAALVLGTAFPHLLKSLMDDFRWEDVVSTISGLAIIGGMMIFFLVPDGPFRKAAGKFDKGMLFKIFRNKNLRAAAFGYFGHMWEVYAFWTFVPLMVGVFIYTSEVFPNDVSRFSFFIIGIGSLACIIGGILSGKIGSYRVAFYALSASAVCCIVSPLIFTLNPAFIYIFFLIWGMAVIMDSPQFSSLIAQSAEAENKASALTIVNSIGFSITIISIQMINFLSDYIDPQWLFVFLFPGPALGLYAMLQWERPRQVF